MKIDEASINHNALKLIDEISRLDADFATKSRLLCSRMVRQCKCANCLHKLECNSLNKPVSEKAESIAKIIFHDLPVLRRVLKCEYSQYIKIEVNHATHTGAICTLRVYVNNVTEYRTLGKIICFIGTEYYTIEQAVRYYARNYIEGKL